MEQYGALLYDAMCNRIPCKKLRYNKARLFRKIAEPRATTSLSFYSGTGAIFILLHISINYIFILILYFIFIFSISYTEK